MDWTCPFCRQHADVDAESVYLDIYSQEAGPSRAYITTLHCPNPKCRQTEIVFRRKGGGKIMERRLCPESDALVLPSYIPTAIAEDYYEACRIRDLSPKASATLARRALQGMIRDFHGVVKKRLFDEIAAIQSIVTADVWAAIDAVRQVGNIGAHMEGDINLIIDVDADEAQLLIGLIETLIEEWYVERHERAQRLAKVQALAQQKKALKTQAASSGSPTPSTAPQSPSPKPPPASP